jgi:hypothetical protein
MNMSWREKSSCNSITAFLLGASLVVGGAVVSAADEAPVVSPPTNQGIESRGSVPLQRTPMQPGLAAPSASQALQAVPSGPPSSPCNKNIPPEFLGPYTPPTYYQTVPAAAFSLALQPVSGLHFQSSGYTIRAWRDPSQVANLIRFVAPLYLPQGAVIRQIEIFLRDDDPQYNLYFALDDTVASTGPNPGLYGTYLWMTTANCVNGSADTMLLITGLAIPINSQHAYSMRIEWDVNNLNNATFDNGIQLHFIRIGYTLQ